MRHFSMVRLLALTLALSLVACGTTRITSSWRGPEARSARFEKVAALALVQNEASRREAEDEIAKQVRHAKAVPGYTLLATSELQDHEAVKAKLRANGFDGVVVLRLVRAEKQYSWSRDTPPDSYYSFSSYYRMAQPASHDSADLEETTVVRVETTVYSLADDGLVWACLSDTTASGSVSRLVASIAKVCADELESEGLLTER